MSNRCHFDTSYKSCIYTVDVVFLILHYKIATSEGANWYLWGRNFLQMWRKLDLMRVLVRWIGRKPCYYWSAWMDHANCVNGSRKIVKTSCRPAWTRLSVVNYIWFQLVSVNLNYFHIDSYHFNTFQMISNCSTIAQCQYCQCEL